MVNSCKLQWEQDLKETIIMQEWESMSIWLQSVNKYGYNNNNNNNNKWYYIYYTSKMYTRRLDNC